MMLKSLCLDITPYAPWHLDTFVPGIYDVDSCDLLRAKPEWAGWAVSLRHDARTLGVVAVSRLPDRVVVGVIASDELRAHPRTCMEVAIVSLPALVRAGGGVPVEIEVDDAFPAARRFAEWLGFIDTPNGNMSYEPR